MDNNDLKLRHVEMERLKKWEKMMTDWNSTSTKEKLRRRIYKGIPNRLRGRVWTLLLGIEALKQEQAGKYDEMLKLARQWSTEIRQIDADVARQYRDHINYRWVRANTKNASLKSIIYFLHAIANTSNIFAILPTISCFSTICSMRHPLQVYYLLPNLRQSTDVMVDLTYAFTHIYYSEQSLELFA